MKDTFNKVVMDETRQEEIRAALMGKKRAKKTWLAPVIAVAAAIAIVFIVPATRTVIVNAAEELLTHIIVEHNKSKIEISQSRETDENGEKAYEYLGITMTFEEGGGFAQEKDGRLFFVLDDEWKDVTDICSSEEFYRYEEKLDDGSKCVIFVGGTPDDYGYTQLFFNQDGEYLTQIGQYHGNPGWLKKAFENEGLTADDIFNGDFDGEIDLGEDTIRIG